VTGTNSVLYIRFILFGQRAYRKEMCNTHAIPLQQLRHVHGFVHSWCPSTSLNGFMTSTFHKLERRVPAAADKYSHVMENDGIWLVHLGYCVTCGALVLVCTVFQRREGEASTKFRLSVLCKLKTSARFLDHSYHYHYTVSQNNGIHML
jgi:hypothetical protein